ncbi:hypothetical protein Cs7R123_32750 [Catellatospora sp. TT07R-123]|nr:hypothetical protein Cs7R123_32750 [Catellatospora sp. TT07R-123]
MFAAIDAMTCKLILDGASYLRRGRVVVKIRTEQDVGERSRFKFDRKCYPHKCDTV